MPSDFLLPLFVVTLLANAVLVAVAIRGMRRGAVDLDRSDGGDRPSGGPPGSTPPPLDRPMTDDLLRAIAARRTALDAPTADPGPSPSGGDPPPPIEAPPAIEERGPEAAVAPVPGSEPEPLADPESPPTPKRRRPSKAADTIADKPRPAGPARPTGSTGPARPTERPRGNRRKFSLPPLDDDHERVNRSIESFLGGTDQSAPATTSDRDARGAASHEATTIALVAVGGLPMTPSVSRGSFASDFDDEVTSAALAMVERTVRSAARGTDVVTEVGRGRYRVVLAATGELAARAYLRRIRATVEPLLKQGEHPLRLAVATATALDEPIEAAEARAGRRLDSALALDAGRDTDRQTGAADIEPYEATGDTTDGPRAAAD